MEKIKRIALVAHDTCKKDLVEWVEWNWQTLSQHHLVCTGTTGRLVEDALTRKQAEHKVMYPLNIVKLKSGPLGGDQQLGAMICEGKIDVVIFLWDPMNPQPHDVDVKALLRIIVLYDVVTATSRSTADFIISSPLFSKEYHEKPRDFSSYINRKIN
ncbi:MAG: methylglyoxal synthase [Bacteroidota bacterium]|jgi:methylglyoxal synthase|nr:methylglyoxal synthase [Bacteroidota bacterium]